MHDRAAALDLDREDRKQQDLNRRAAGVPAHRKRLLSQVVQ
eukprot:COSAG06_NODE_5902_length_3221_cov_14.117233_4_plen_41_part_00